jgi:flagellar basal body-associated protein FliL
MFANVTVRTKILTLLGVAVLALLVVVLIAFMGLKKQGEMLAEIGKNRMPSVQALMSINEAKTGIRSANRAADAAAMYPENVAEITQQIKRRAEQLRRPIRRGKSTSAAANGRGSGGVENLRQGLGCVAQQGCGIRQPADADPGADVGKQGAVRRAA